MKFYLASKYSKRYVLLPIAALLQLQGHIVTSQWLNGSHEGNTKEDAEKWARIDLQQIDDCSHFVLFNIPFDDPEPSSGRHVELGYAIAQGKTIIIVGEGDCIFYTQADNWFINSADFLAEIAPNSKL